MTEGLTNAIICFIAFSCVCMLILTVAKVLKMLFNYFDKLDEKSNKKLIKDTIKEFNKKD